MPTKNPALLTVLTLPALLIVGAEVIAADDASVAPPPIVTERTSTPVPPTVVADTITTGAEATQMGDRPSASTADRVVPGDTIVLPPTSSARVDVAVDHATSTPPTRRSVDVVSPQSDVTTALLESSFAAAPIGDPLPDLGPAVCLDEVDEADALVDVFGTGLIAGADYQRAFPLPSGRLLWLFQDAFLPTSHGPELVHNVGLVQSGSCFQLLRAGSGDRPIPYLFADLTDRYDRWFWPLGGGIAADGNLVVFVAEMVEHGGGYLQHTEPVATWLVTIDPEDLTVVERRPAPDPSPTLHGWSVVSHGGHSYLYGHCYRQFGWGNVPFTDGPPRVHDWSCTADVTVARVSRGRFDEAPQYWDGTDWVDEPSAAVGVFPTDGRAVNATQVGVHDGRFVAVTKVDDWWSERIVLDTAPTPAGPWTTYDTVTVDPMCDDCNTYFASIVPFADDDESFAISISNNTWAGHDLTHYRPTVMRVALPTT